MVFYGQPHPYSSALYLPNLKPIEFTWAQLNHSVTNNSDIVPHIYDNTNFPQIKIINMAQVYVILYVKDHLYIKCTCSVMHILHIFYVYRSFITAELALKYIFGHFR